MDNKISRASEGIANLSDQIEGYSQEIAKTIENISEQYNVSKEFALLIVQSGIENMRLDVEHHKNYHIELVADALVRISEAIENISEDL